MRIEKWRYKDKEINVPIFDDDEIESNEDIEYPELEKTLELPNILEVEDDK